MGPLLGENKNKQPLYAMAQKAYGLNNPKTES